MLCSFKDLGDIILTYFGVSGRAQIKTPSQPFTDSRYDPGLSKSPPRKSIFPKIRFRYRITSNNSRGNYRFFTFFPAGIIRGRELLEGGNY